jgi:hypothetical protein
MADFARFIIAAEAALPWQPGDFLKAYRKARRETVVTLADGDLVATSVLAFIGDRSGWEGLVSELYRVLSGRMLPETRRGTDWPGNARWFSDRLRRASPALRALGVDVRDKRDGRGSHLIIRKIAPLASLAAQPKGAEHLEDDANVASDPMSPLSEADWAALIDENAGIKEYDGGLSRAEAEVLAAREVAALRGEAASLEPYADLSRSDETAI